MVLEMVSFFNDRRSHVTYNEAENIFHIDLLDLIPIVHVDMFDT